MWAGFVSQLSLWLLPSSNASFLIEVYPVGLCVSKHQFNDSKAAIGLTRAFGLAVAVMVAWGKMH